MSLKFREAVIAACASAGAVLVYAGACEINFRLRKPGRVARLMEYAQETLTEVDECKETLGYGGIDWSTVKIDVQSYDWQPGDFEVGLRHILNSSSAENVSNTPDYILADFLKAALLALNTAVQDRDKWYRISPSPDNKE